MSNIKADKDFVFNLDINLAKLLDDALTLYNDTRKGYKGESEEEWQDTILDIRDGFRRYHNTEFPEWSDEAQKDIEETCSRLGEVFSGLWQ